MRNFWMNSRILLWAALIFYSLCPIANAESIFIQDFIGGELRFSGFPISNPDGSTTLLGLAYRGDVIEGNLAGEWALIMKATYPGEGSPGTVEGVFAVGIRKEAAVYGIVTGDIDPVAGDFSFIIVIIGGKGLYEGFVGVGDFSGTLNNEGEYIEGDLLMILSDSESEQLRNQLEKGYKDNPALSLLE